MGWAAGSQIAEEAWDLVRDFIPEEEKPDIAQSFIDLFEEHDADTMEEAEQLWADAAGADEDDWELDEDDEFFDDEDDDDFDDDEDDWDDDDEWDLDDEDDLDDDTL